MEVNKMVEYIKRERATEAAVNAVWKGTGVPGVAKAINDIYATT